MDFFNVLSLLGGLALFLYGMNAMGDGLAKLSGGKMEKILEKLTTTKAKGVLLALRYDVKPLCKHFCVSIL